MIDKAIISVVNRGAVQGTDDLECGAFLIFPWTGRKSDVFQKKALSAISQGFPKVKAWVDFTTVRAFSRRKKDVLPTTSMNV